MLFRSLGQMMALHISPQYEKDRQKFNVVISKHAKKIDKTVDLFSRSKNSEQAEEVLTVLFACRELKASRPHEEVEEQQLYDYVLSWKKTWQAEEKKQAVASAIRNLVMLGWMRLKVSESLQEAA